MRALPARVLAGAATCLALATACGPGGGAQSGDGPVARRPNVVFIVADDVGYADLSGRGSEIPTPQIDSIAARGARFTSGYVAAPVCSPSRAALLTGRYPQRFGHENHLPGGDPNGLPADQRTLADLARERGYRTGAIGKWHLGESPPYHPNRRGFEEFFGFLGARRTYRPYALRSRPAQRLQRDGAWVREEGYLTDRLGRAAAEFIGRHASAPFFLYLCFAAVHHPTQADPERLARVPDLGSERRRVLAAILGALDENVGRVLTALREHQLETHTLLVFLSDNGGAAKSASSNAPLRGWKGGFFEGGIRVPFLAQWPGQIPAGRVVDAPVSALDLLPTALAAMGGAADRDLDGFDLLPLARGEVQHLPRRDLYWRNGGSAGAAAVRQGDWKLIRPAGAAALLFDLAADPSEQRDLAAAQPAVVARLERALAAWERELIEPRWSGAPPGGQKARRRAAPPPRP